VLHLASCAAPGALAGALAWWFVAARLEVVPLVGRRVFQGDLGLPLAGAVAAAALGAGLVVLAGLARPRRDAGVQPTASLPRRPGLVRLLPLVGALALTGCGVAVPGEAGARLVLLGVTLSTVGAIVAAPVVVDRVGAGVARRDGVGALLLGRRLQWSARSGPRSLLALGTVATLVPVVASWVAVARAHDPVVERRAGAVEVHGPLETTAVGRLAGAADAVPASVAVRQVGDAPPEISLVADCGALRAVVPTLRCDRVPFGVPVSDLGQQIGGGPEVAGRPVVPEGADIVSTLFVTRDLARTDAVLRAAIVNGDHAGLQVLTPGRRWSHESPLVDWILGAAALAGLVGALALVLHLVGQAAEVARSRQRLLALGTDLAVLRRLAGSEAAAVVAMVGGLSAAVGAGLSWLFVQRDPVAAFPVAVLVAVVGASLGAAAIAGAAAAVSVSRSDRPLL
jgi:hypothetical protein